MSSTGKKILGKVFICQQDNRLQLVEIEFDNIIRSIRPLMNGSVSWNDVKTEAGRKNFTVQLPAISPGHINGNCLLAIPGTIDAHVHFNTPGFEHRDDFEHGSAAAAAGGVTTVIDMPCTSVPPVTSADNLKIKQKTLENRSLVDFALWGGISGNTFNGEFSAEKIITELADAGAAGFKAYIISGMESFPDLTYDQMIQAARFVRNTGRLLAVHAEDKIRVKSREEEFRKQGRDNWQAYTEMRDVEAERVAVRQLVEICHRSGCRIHIVHLSSGKAVEIVRQARKEGLPFSAETCPHYLYFTEKDFERSEIRAFLKTAPPVKSEKDRKMLWDALVDGTLDFVTTDHAGCNPEVEKNSEKFSEVYGGIPGVEHRIPFLFSEGFHKNRLTLQRTIELLAENPARSFGLSSRKGFLKKGMDADLVLINLWSQEKITAEKMHSKGKYTPFEGYSLTARVEQTFLRGRQLLGNDGEPLPEYGYGEWIKPVPTV